jgi:hypothetical protein
VNAKPSFVVVAVFAFCFFVSAGMTCGDDDDVGDDDTGDDDTGDDDGADDDTSDDDAADDDSEGYTCEDLAYEMINTCWFTLPDAFGNALGEYDLALWCEFSEALFADNKLESPFWNCVGDCVYVEVCDEECVEYICLDPPAPGTECGDTVDAVYACNIVWVLEEGYYYIFPEMDLQVACEFLTDWPWDCYGDCALEECDTMLECLVDCETFRRKQRM